LHLRPRRPSSSPPTRKFRAPLNEDCMSAVIINLDEERGRRRSQEPAAPPPTPSNLYWKLSQRGNPYAVVNEAFHIVLFRRAGVWAFRIEDLETGQAWFSERRYQNGGGGEGRCSARGPTTSAESTGTKP